MGEGQDRGSNVWPEGLIRAYLEILINGFDPALGNLVRVTAANKLLACIQHQLSTAAAPTPTACNSCASINHHHTWEEGDTPVSSLSCLVWERVQQRGLQSRWLSWWSKG
jgi:hypothetical protein